MTYLLKFFKSKINFILYLITFSVKKIFLLLKIFIYLFHRKAFVVGYDEYKWYRIKKKN